MKGLPRTSQTGPTAALYEVVAGHRFRVSAGSFFQTGPAAAGLLVDAVRRAAPEFRRRHVVDAYAGVGLFAVAATAPDCRTTCSRELAVVGRGRLGQPRRPGRDVVRARSGVAARAVSRSTS